MSRDKVATVAERATAVEEALTAKGHLAENALDGVQQIEEALDWHNGAKVVARAWTHPEYKERLLEDGTGACAELGFEGPQGEYIVVIEDTPQWSGHPKWAEFLTEFGEKEAAFKTMYDEKEVCTHQAITGATIFKAWLTWLAL